MNKEEIANLEDYLRNNLPRIEPTIPITSFGSVNLDDLMDSIKQFKEIPKYDELLKENKILRIQLKEKSKVIDEMLDFFGTNDCPNSIDWIDEKYSEQIQKICNCSNCQDTYKNCWLKYFENKILGRGKNDN